MAVKRLRSTEEQKPKAKKMATVQQSVSNALVAAKKDSEKGTNRKANASPQTVQKPVSYASVAAKMDSRQRTNRKSKAGPDW